MEEGCGPSETSKSAKKTPENRGNFVTRGCYLTAGILFAAANLHKLAMFTHFPDEAGAWASPYNSGTKTTGSIISDLQGKTTELQYLDSQPTFGDILDRSAKVQFSVSAKRRVAASGIEVKSSSKRKQRAFAFKRCERPNQSADYREVTSYTYLREMQKEAHRKGVKDGQDLFEKYMPRACTCVLTCSRKIAVGTCHTNLRIPVICSCLMANFLKITTGLIWT